MSPEERGMDKKVEYDVKTGSIIQCLIGFKVGLRGLGFRVWGFGEAA